MTDACDVDVDNRFTRSFGFPVEKIATKKKNFLPERVQDFIKESPFLVMSTCDSEGRCDASPKGGKPGFVRILDDRHLLVPDVEGNKLFDSYRNMDKNPHVGLIFFIPGISEAARVNGRAVIVSRDELGDIRIGDTVYNPSEERGLLQGVIIEVEEAYGHCPRAMNYSDLWNPETIQERKASGANPMRINVAAAASR